MRAQEIMTRDPACCAPEDSVQQAAQLMAQKDCGAIPVVQDWESRRLAGMVTDRDLACRCLALGMGAETEVRQVMSRDPSTCRADAELEDVQRIMSERKVRRVPVVDEQGRCIGIIAQADLARAAGERRVSEQEVARVVERVSQPPGGRRETGRASTNPGT